MYIALILMVQTKKFYFEVKFFNSFSDDSNESIIDICQLSLKVLSFVDNPEEYKIFIGKYFTSENVLPDLSN